MEWHYKDVKDLVYRLKNEPCTDSMVYSVCKDFEIERGLVSKALYNYNATASGTEHELVRSLRERGLEKIEILLALDSDKDLFEIDRKRVIHALMNS